MNDVFYLGLALALFLGSWWLAKQIAEAAQ